MIEWRRKLIEYRPHSSFFSVPIMLQDVESINKIFTLKKKNKNLIIR